jgi:uncharacterized protein
MPSGRSARHRFFCTARSPVTRPGAESDLDLFIDYNAAGRFNALDLVGIKLFLEEAFELSVDVTTRDSFDPMFKDGIEQSALQVF